MPPVTRAAPATTIVRGENRMTSRDDANVPTAIAMATGMKPTPARNGLYPMMFCR